MRVLLASMTFTMFALYKLFFSRIIFSTTFFVQHTTVAMVP
jgi:hypothetical protein